MKVAIIATLCHTMIGQQPACRDETIIEADMGIGIGCLVSEAQALEWKERSIYAGLQWTVTSVRCAPGGYTPKVPT